MVFGEYNYEEDVAVQREEAAEEASRSMQSEMCVKYATKMLSKEKKPQEIITEMIDLFDLDESTIKSAVEVALNNVSS